MSMLNISQNPLSLTLTWNFVCSDLETLGEGIESSRFEIEFIGPITWCLVFYPSGFKNPNYVACFLKQCGGYCKGEAIVDLKLSLKAKSGTNTFVKSHSNLRISHGCNLGFSEFVSIEELRRCNFTNGKLTLQWCLSSGNDTKYVKDFILLSNDIKLLYDKNTFYDVIIRAGNNEFKVHKTLLIARFPCLVDKIECSHYEESIPFVTISDFSPEIVREVIHFIYTGKLTAYSANRCNHEKLKKFALKYNMVNLLQKLKWDIRECTMNTYLTITDAKQNLDVSKLLYFKQSKNCTFSGSVNVTDNTKLNVMYKICASLQGLNVNIGLSTETKVEWKNSLQVKLNCYFKCGKNETVSCYECSTYINNSGNNMTSGIAPSHCVSFLIKNDILVNHGLTTNLQQVYMVCDWNVRFRRNTISTLHALKDTLTGFSDDMYELFQKGIGTDMVLKTVSDGTEFCVHKSIVCARVPSIMAMFKGDTEAVNGYVHNDIKNVKVDIPDVDSNTFKDILKYIYCGTIEASALNKVLQLYPKLVPIYMKQL